MKNFKKRFIAFSAMIAVVLGSCVSCTSKKEKAPSLTEQEKSEVAEDALTFTYDSEDEDDTSADLNAADPTEPNGDTAPAETQIVTDAQGQPVTEIVTVTNADGQPATDAEGQPATEIITVTETVTGGSNNNNNNNNNRSANTNTPDMRPCEAWWINIAQEKDFVFNNDFIAVDFEIRENAPTGKTPINITKSDFSNLAAQTAIHPTSTYNNFVYINQDKEDISINDDGNFLIYTDAASGKPGDIVTVVFNIKNNPGLCAVDFAFEYDKNVLKIVDTYAVGEYAEIANASFIK